MTTRVLRGFEYLEPNSVEEATSMLEQYGDDARLLAGGTDLLVLMKRRELIPKAVIATKKIPGLRYIDVNHSGVRIGAMTTLKDIEKSSMLAEKCPVLLEAVMTMASVQIRARATVAGNICNASPSADTAPPLLASDSLIKLIGPKGEREIPLDSFFIGPGKTVLKRGEMVAEINIPSPSRSGWAFIKSGRTSFDLAKLNVAVVLSFNEGSCVNAGIAIGGAASTPLRVPEAEKELINKRLDKKILANAAEIAAGKTSPITDIRSTSGYRRELAKVLLRRALELAIIRERGAVS